MAMVVCFNVWNFGHLVFGFVSDFDILISDFQAGWLSVTFK